MMLSETACKAEIVDHSALAAPFKEFPSTLGIRSQTLMMKFVEPQSAGEFFPPSMDKNDFVKQLENDSPHALTVTIRNNVSIAGGIGFMDRFETPGVEAFASCLKQENILRAFIGEIVSIVYAPFFVNGQTVIDGITGRPAFKTKNAEALLAPREKDPFKLAFIPTLCPNCNWNLQGEKQTLVLVCPHCGTAWQASEQGMQPVDARAVFSGSDGAAWVPFWALDVDYGALNLSSFGDFIRLTNLSVLVRPERREKRFLMWIPAFKVNPELFFRLGKQMSVLQREIQKTEAMPKHFYPVTLPVSEAFQSLPIVLGEMAVAKKKMFPFVKNAAFSLRGAVLAFVPFVERGSEIVQPESNIAINKNALIWGRGM